MVIAYLRVSTGKQNLENQKDEIARYATKVDITIDKWITEVVSGKTKRKDRALGKVLKTLNSGDTLIVTELSRLSRTLHEVMAIMGICLDKKISVYSTKDGFMFNDSINSKVLSFAFGLVAEIEHKLISQRTKEALALKRKQGVVLGRKKGSSPKLKILTDNRKEIIKRIKAGQSLASICRHFEVSFDTFKVFRKTDTLVNQAIESKKTLKKERQKDARAAN